MKKIFFRWASKLIFFYLSLISKNTRNNMGRWYNGNINGKFWFGIQDSCCIEELGGVVENPERNWNGCGCTYNINEVLVRHSNNLNFSKLAFKELSKTALSDDLVEKIVTKIEYPNQCSCSECFDNVEEHMKFAGILCSIDDWVDYKCYCEDGGAMMWINKDDEEFLEIMLEMKNTIEEWNIDLTYSFDCSDGEVEFDDLDYNENNIPPSTDKKNDKILANYTMGLLIEEYFRLNPDETICEFYGEF